MSGFGSLRASVKRFYTLGLKLKLWEELRGGNVDFFQKEKIDPFFSLSARRVSAPFCADKKVSDAKSVVDLQQICHRDLKLENTLLDGSPAPRLKICDFGYSKVPCFSY